MAGGTREAATEGPYRMGSWRSRVLGAAAALDRARPQGPSALSEHLGLLPTKHSPSPPSPSISTHIYQLIIQLERRCRYGF